MGRVEFCCLLVLGCFGGASCAEGETNEPDVRADVDADADADAGVDADDTPDADVDSPADTDVPDDGTEDSVADDTEAEVMDGDDAEDSAEVEADAAPRCGNGIVESGEECDGAPPRTCTTSCGSTGSESCVLCSWTACAVPPESCNGADDDCNGVVDDSPGCWRAIYRFRDASSSSPQPRCLGPATTAPTGCTYYTYELEAFVVAAYPVSGTYPAVQCSLLTDHILVEDGSADETSLVSAGYDCSVALGNVFRVGSAPSAATPFANTCPLWRFRYTATGGGAHLFTRGADDVTGMTCEPPARGVVFSDFACFTGTPSGC